MIEACRQANCTIAQTGKCLLNREPPATCPNLVLEVAETTPLSDSNDATEVLATPPARPKFPLSLSLTPEQTRLLMGRRYCRMVGILGMPDSGKTAALVSLYLLLARARLEGVQFANSLSLRAFDDISHGARRWSDGALPEQLTTHTELADGRSAGFLHLRLHVKGHCKPVDLLLPDLPGEWSSALVDANRVDRLSFLKRADAIWLMVDGRQLADLSLRHWTLHRITILLERLAALLPSMPPVFLVISRRDQGEPDAEILNTFRDRCLEHGWPLKVVSIASFSELGSIPAGFGISDLLALTVQNQSERTTIWPDRIDMSEGERAILRFPKAEVKP